MPVNAKSYEGDVAMVQESIPEKDVIMIDEMLHPTHELVIISCAGQPKVHDCLDCDKCFICGSAEGLLHYYDTAQCCSQRQVLQVMDTLTILQGPEVSSSD